MPNKIRDDITTIDEDSFPYIFEQNVTVHLRDASGLVRCNTYKPKGGTGKWPVLVTFGPYGKDIPYQDFHPASFAEVNPKHKSAHSAWEVPDPGYWTAQGYAIVRADEPGLGQSPGKLDTFSRQTTDAFVEVIEWAAEQSWSTGKVGILGISYFASSQWAVAARRPKGLACIVPWEGMNDQYRDFARHGGIYSNAFIRFWWDRQVVSNQYGRPGRAVRKWGPDTIEGDLSGEELLANRVDSAVVNDNNHFRDDLYYAAKEFDLNDIEVPLLSVANWGGIHLHLRGNVQGWVNASSRLKYLRFITGRHDLPFFYDEEVEVQRSFLDAFLKGEDRGGWSNGTAPRVDLVLRKGDVGYNNPEAEKTFARRVENEWPLARTQYTPYYLTPDLGLTTSKPNLPSRTKLGYKALGTLNNPQMLRFSTTAFEHETEITGHTTAHLNVSVSPEGHITPTDIDLFLTLRHFSADGKEIFYTGTAGDNIPLCQGWLRVSLRKVNAEHPRHQSYLPYRDYFSTDVLPVIPGEVYPVDVEVWPTNVIMEKGDRLVFEVASGDTQGCKNFQHNSPTDRAPARLAGRNFIHFSAGDLNYITLPIIPS